MKKENSDPESVSIVCALNTEIAVISGYCSLRYCFKALTEWVLIFGFLYKTALNFKGLKN